MKNVLFDLFSAQSSSGLRSGGYEFIFSIFSRLSQYHNKDIVLSVFYNFDIGLYEWIEQTIKESGIKSYDVKNIHEIYDICEKNNIDIFYSGMPYKYTFEFASDRVVKIGSFHGLRAYELPDDEFLYKYSAGSRFRKTIRKPLWQIRFIPMVKQRRWNRRREYEKTKMQAAITQFDKITCESYHSKYAFKNLFREQVNDIKVFYAPEKVRTLSTSVSDENYILITMSDRFRKNAYRAILAVNNLQKAGHIPNVKTIVTGVASDIIKEEFKDNRNIQYTNGYLENAQFEQLYANCKIYIFPTLNEGFGYPPLEAMAYGKTCVVGANTSLTEICGDAVYYVNAYDVFELQTRILEAIERPIDTEKVLNRYNEVKAIQNKSLEGICNYIMGRI